MYQPTFINRLGFLLDGALIFHSTYCTIAKRNIKQCCTWSGISDAYIINDDGWALGHCHGHLIRCTLTNAQSYEIGA